MEIEEQIDSDVKTVLKRYKNNEVKLHHVYSIYEKNWSTLSSSRKKAFLEEIGKNIQFSSVVYEMLDNFQNHTALDQYLLDTYNLLNDSITKAIHYFPVLPAIDGGLLFELRKEGEECRNPTFSLPSIEYDNTSVVTIQMWISFVSQKQIFDASTYSACILTLSNVLFLHQLHLQYVPSENHPFSIHMHTFNQKDLTEPPIITIFPISFPALPFSKEIGCSASYLFSLSFSQPSIISIFINSTLCSEINLSLPFNCGDFKASLGDEGQRQLTEEEKRRKSMQDLDAFMKEGRIGLIISSFVYVAGAIPQDYLSTLYLLGPYYYQIGSCPPRYMEYSKVFTQEKPLLFWEASQLTVKYRIDLCDTNERDEAYCFKEEKRTTDLANFTVYSEEGSEVQPVSYVSLNGYGVYRFKNDINYILTLDFHVKLIADLCNMMNMLKNHQNNEYLFPLLKMILSLLASIVALDPSILIFIYRNEVIMLLFSILHYAPKDSIDKDLIDMMLFFFKSLLACDYSVNQMLVNGFYNTILFNPSLYLQLPYELALYLHDSVIKMIREYGCSDSLIQCVSFKEYVQCISNSRICHLSSVEEVLTSYLSSSLSLSYQQMYRILYNAYLCSLYQKNGLFLSTSFRNVLIKHYMSIASAEKKTFTEMNENHADFIMFHLLNVLTRMNTISDNHYSEYLNRRDSDRDYDIILNSIYYASLVFLTILHMNRSKSNQVYGFRSYIYDLLYESFDLFNDYDNQAYRTHYSSNQYRQLLMLYDLYMKEGEVYQLNADTSKKPFKHYKLLPHYLCCLRYNNDMEMIQTFVNEFYASLNTISTKSISTTSSQSDNAMREISSILKWTAIIKEFILLYVHLKAQKCILEADRIEVILSTMLYNDLDDESFSENVSFFVSFSMACFEYQDAITLIGSVITKVVNELTRVEFHPSYQRLKNLQNLIGVIEEICIVNKDQYGLYSSYLLNRLHSTHHDANDDHSDNSTSGNTSAFSKEFVIEEGLRDVSKENAEAEFNKHKAGQFSKELIEVVDINSTLLPLLKKVYEWKSSDGDCEHCKIILKNLFLLLSRVIYNMVYRISKKEFSSEAFTTVTKRIGEMQQWMHKIVNYSINDEEEKKTWMISLLVYYLVFIKECYSLVNSYSEEGRVVLGLLQSDCIYSVESMMGIKDLPFVFNVPMISAALPIEILAFSLFSQITGSFYSISLQLVYSIISQRPLVHFFTHRVYNHIFKHVSIFSMKEGTGTMQSFHKYMDEVEALNASVVEAQSNTISSSEAAACTSIEALIPSWLYISICAKSKSRNSSENYLEKCSYYVVDPHISKDFVRRKTLRIEPPTEQEEERFEVELIQEVKQPEEKAPMKIWKLLGRKEKKAAHSKHTFTNDGNSNWNAMCISTYDAKWGVVRIQSYLLTFMVGKKPATAKEFNVIPMTHSVLPMPLVRAINIRNAYMLFKRSYNCQDSALELFYRDNGFSDSVYLFFPENESRDAVYSLLYSRIPTSPLHQKLNESSTEYLKRNRWEEKWLKNKYTNFEYIMRLNLIAGRSIQDVTQYPVFPWLLREYRTIDFDIYDYHYYRDLCLPMGAQSFTRLNQFISQYEQLEEAEKQERAKRKQSKTLLSSEESIPPYYYGTHYSTTLGCILYYLIREEPFTSIHKALQNNHFDKADRLFDSASVAADSCMQDTNEVRESIAEWYYDERMMINANHQHFGKKQNEEEVNDVKLPCSPSELISRNLEALESTYTTSQLYHWIDLIFGVAQQGPKAQSLYNVFYYLTYSNNNSIDSIDDLQIAESIVTQVAHFGQCPQMLFKASHTKKKLSLSCHRSLRSMLLLSDPKSIYRERDPMWIGNCCRFVTISDYSKDSLLSCASNVNYVLGNTPSTNEIPREFTDDSDTLPLLPSSTSLSWPAQCSYPFSFTIDCNDYCDVSMVKVVFEEKENLSYNIHTNCFQVTILEDEKKWREVEVLNTLCVRKADRVECLIAVNISNTRYINVSIIDLPFTGRLLPLFSKSIPVYSSGEKKENDSTQKVTISPYVGPVIHQIDILGRFIYPIIPKMSSMVFESKEAIRQMCIWNDQLVLLNEDSLELVDTVHEEVRKRLLIPYLQSNHYRVLCVHPQYPLLFIDDNNSGSMLILVLKIDAKNTSIVHSHLRVQVFTRSAISSLTVEDNLIIAHSMNGLVAVFTFLFSTYGNTLKLIFNILPSAFSSTPYAIHYHSVHLLKSMDCVVLYNKERDMSKEEESEELNQRVIILTTRLELRGIIEISSVLFCFSSSYGIFILQREKSRSKLIKYDFCGEEQGTLYLGSIVTCYASSYNNDIFALAMENKEVLLVDALLNKVSTRVPLQVSLKELHFNGRDTALYGVTPSNTVVFIPLNNSMNPKHEKLSNEKKKK